MTDVVMVCVCEDIERAEALAEMFDDFGFSVSDVADDETLRRCGAGVVVWTEAAKTSLELCAAAARVMATGKGVVLNFTDAQAPVGAMLCFDLTAWNGDPDDLSLDRMFFALDRMMIAARATRPAELELAAAAEPIAPRPPARRPARAAPASALHAIAMSLVVIGAALAAGIAVGGAREQQSRAVVRLPMEREVRVTLADVAPLGVTYDLAARPVEDAPVGRRGVEPPSAASGWPAERTPAPVLSWNSAAALSAEQASDTPAIAEPSADKPDEKDDAHV